MKIKVAISTSDLSNLNHKTAVVSSPRPLTLIVPAQNPQLIAPGEKIIAASKSGALEIQVVGRGKRGRLIKSSSAIVKAEPTSHLVLEDLKRADAKGGSIPVYEGELLLQARDGNLRLTLVCELETYLSGVLESEIPGSYHLEAIKAQAVAARTYALNPRISHEADGANVCDSYLCCQYFAGHLRGARGRHKQAIDATRGQILLYNEKPILALFSSNAGGHTENYENCFSDPVSGAFPPEPLAYLKGVPEGNLPEAFKEGKSEEGLKALWSLKSAVTADSWSPHFRWQVSLAASALEGQMHHIIEQMMAQRDMAPFIVPPPSDTFGHIDRFEIEARGVSGQAIKMLIHTSKGCWQVSKELVIRSVFRNPETHLVRLKSARIFFEHKRDKLNLLSEVTIRGLGWGHGVGLQQTGAQGWALKGRKHTEILMHYFRDAHIGKI
ncbi:MAG TPA: SpoIID/LytB domain-containing protein [Candidatus Obscuribacterales bacterium]